MGISGKSDAQKQMDAQSSYANKQADMQGQLTQMQLDNLKQLNPKILKAQESTIDNTQKNLDSTVWNQGRTLAEKTAPQINYEEIGMSNPKVQELKSYFDNNSTAYAKDLLAGSNDKMAGRRITGSSYDAVHKAKLGDLFARMYNENAINALNTYQGIYGNNMNNAMNLVKFGMGDPSGVQMPAYQLNYNNPYPQQAQQAEGSNQTMEMIGGLIGAVVPTVIAAVSDKRMKQNIVKLGQLGGINIYSFNYKSEFIDKYNLPMGTQIGVMAQEVEHISGAVIENEDGYKFVDYHKITKAIGEKKDV